MRRFLLVFILLSSLTALAILAPTVFPVTKTGTEDVTVTFTADDFKDVNDGDILTKIKITSLPANGKLYLSGSAITATDLEKEIDVSQIANLTLVPDPDHNGEISFGWNGSDATEYAAAPSTVTVTLSAVNDAPTFTIASDPAAVNEDAGAQSVAGFATAIDDGDVDVTQGLTFNVTENNNPGLFSVLPAIDPATGDLTYTPAADQSGAATIKITLSDDGPGAAPDVNTSPEQTFIITVNPVNDVPSFVKGGDKTVLEDAGPQSVSGWATNISEGATDEAGQVLTFNVSNNNSGLFSVQPAIAADGTLTYTPTPNANGTATVTVSLSDDGGIANGGDDQSDDQTFTITVTPVNDQSTVSNVSKTTTLGATVLFTAEDFSSKFTGDGPLTEIQITSLPTTGKLYLGPDPVALNQKIKVEDLNKLNFVPSANYTGASFGWNGTDGTEYAATGATVYINMTGRPIVLFNEFYTDPATAKGNSQYFELYNSSPTESVKLDCYTLIIYYTKGDKPTDDKGYYVLDFPDVTIGPLSYSIGSATTTATHKTQGCVERTLIEGLDFSWNKLKGTSGSLKKYRLKSDNSGYTITDLTASEAISPTAEILIGNKNLLTQGVVYAFFLFDNGSFVNGFMGGYNSGTVPSLFNSMPPLPMSSTANCSATSINLSQLKSSEYVIATPGTDNGYTRKYDGKCGEWVKASNPTNDGQTCVYRGGEHTPGVTNGSATNITTNNALAVSTQRTVCGTRIDFEITGISNFNYTLDAVFPVAVQLYEDVSPYNKSWDGGDILLGTYTLTKDDLNQFFSFLSLEMSKTYFIVFRTNLGCIDKIVIPPSPQLNATAKSFCGKELTITLNDADFDAFLDGAITAQVYWDKGTKSGQWDAGDEFIPDAEVVINEFNKTVEYVLPEGYKDLSYVVVFSTASGSTTCAVSSARASAANGSLSTFQDISCDYDLGGYQVRYNLLGATGDANYFSQEDEKYISLPVTVRIFIDTDNSGRQFEEGDYYIKEADIGIEPDPGDPDKILEIEITNFNEGEKIIKNIRQSYLSGTTWYVEYTDASGCFSKTEPVFSGCWLLPATLTNFSATRNKGVVKLKWETATEQKNKGFYVQRNVRGMWENRGFVSSAATGGNSNTPLSYTFNDANDERGVSQYRLQQVDLDNKIAYSPIRSVPGLEQANKVVIYPNPSDAGKFNVVFSDQGFKRVVVSDVSGRVVRQYRSVQNSLVVDQLEPGMYTVQIIDLSSAETSVEKVIIKKR